MSEPKPDQRAQPLIEDAAYDRSRSGSTRSERRGKRSDQYGPDTKVAIYVRVSSEEQVEGHSLDAQENACQQFAKMKDWQVFRIYRDPGYSAKDDDRPAFKMMMEDAQRGRFQAILIHKLDRFMRNMELTSKYFNILVELDILLTTVEVDFDFSSTHGKLMFHVMAAFAEWYLDNLGQEVEKARREMFRKGIHNGMIPFGYVRKEKGKAPEIVPEEGVIVKKAFQMYASGQYSDWDIANYFNDEGFLTRRDNRWSKDTVRVFLKNEFYFGYVRYKKKITKGNHQAIISRELYDRCQLVRMERAGNKRGKKRPTKQNPKKYLLQQIIRCPACDRVLRIHISGRIYRYYREVSPERGLECEQAGQSIRMEDADAQVLAILGGLKLPKDWQSEIERRADDLDLVAKVQKERARIEDRIRRLDDVYANGRHTRDAYLKKREELVSELDTWIVPQGAVAIEKGLIIDSLGDYLQEATHAEQSEITHLVLEAVYPDFERGVIAQVKPAPDFLPLFRLAAKEMGWMEDKDGRFRVI